MLGCSPANQIQKAENKVEKKLQRKLDRNKRKYIKLEKKWSSHYPDLFNGDTTWVAMEIPRVDTFYLTGNLIDTTTQVNGRDTITVEKDGVTTTVIKSYRDTIEHWRIITRMDSFKFIVHDTIRINYPVIETKYVVKSTWLDKVKSILAIMSILLLLVITVRGIYRAIKK